MQSNKPFALIALAVALMGATSHSWATDLVAPVTAAEHAKTVDELLSAESGQLSAKAHPITEVKHAVVASAAPEEAFEVESVWGVTGDKHALVTLDGVPATVSVGESLGRFKVASIGGGCVDLQGLKGLTKARRTSATKARHGSSVPPFGGAAEVEHRKACFHESLAAGAPVGLAPPQGPVRAAPLPLVPAAVPVPVNGQLAPVQLPH